MAAEVVVARVGVAAVAPFALEMSLLSPTSAAEAAEPELPTRLLPPVESSAADPAIPTVPQGDFSVAADDLSLTAGLASPAATGKGRARTPLDVADIDLNDYEVVEQDQYWTSYDVPGGSDLMVLSERPQNVLVDGEWKSVDGRLIRAEEGWVWERDDEREQGDLADADEAEAESSESEAPAGGEGEA